ncbi:MAG: polysaccharide biosynthesis/export family protein [Cyclobacteriaceae bacterium]|jgi:polysaccharide export outer membrane protein|nr:polysaccharide biosynthesis/export family protein [Cyclobacteriaceae bacterium]
MFRVNENAPLQKAATVAEKNYTLQPNDQIALLVFTKKGERIIDPDGKLVQQGLTSATQTSATSTGTTKPLNEFVLTQTGEVVLPLVGLQKLQGLTIREAELYLIKEYEKFYNDVLVTVTCKNHRVIVLGANGGKVLPLTRENITLAEVLAMAGSGNVQAEGNAHNIRLLRGKEAFVADFSTVEGYVQTNYIIVPGDIVYFEPIKRPGLQALQDYGPIVNILLGVATVAILIQNSN